MKLANVEWPSVVAHLIFSINPTTSVGNESGLMRVNRDEEDQEDDFSTLHNPCSQLSQRRHELLLGEFGHKEINGWTHIQICIS